MFYDKLRFYQSELYNDYMINQEDNEGWDANSDRSKFMFQLRLVDKFMIQVIQSMIARSIYHKKNGQYQLCYQYLVYVYKYTLVFYESQSVDILSNCIQVCLHLCGFLIEMKQFRYCLEVLRRSSKIIDWIFKVCRDNYQNEKEQELFGYVVDYLIMFIYPYSELNRISNIHETLILIDFIVHYYMNVQSRHRCKKIV